MIVFSNPGVIHPLAITTMGINAKNSTSAIGIFGTGLKFAIAVLLRNGCGVHIISGGIEYTFSARSETVRDKEFEIVQMTTRLLRSIEEADERGFTSGRNTAVETKDLGFTTALGRNWKLWHAYRELYCNCVTDESGTVEYVLDETPIGCAPDHTIVVVTGEAFDKIHEDRHDFILNKERVPFLVVPGVIEVYEGASWTVFYKGIKIGDVPGGDGSRYTYNVLSWMYLSEDREMLLSSQFTEDVAKAVMSGLDLKYSEDVLTIVNKDGDARKGVEVALNYNGQTLIESVFQIAKRVIEDTKKKVHSTFMGSFRDYERENLLSRHVDTTADEQASLNAAISACEQIGFKWNGKIGVVADLGAGIKITSKGDVILLSIDLLQGDPRDLWKTLGLQIAEVIIDEKVETRDFAREIIDRMFDLKNLAISRPEVITPVWEDPDTEFEEPEPELEPEAPEFKTPVDEVYVLTGEWSGYSNSQQKISHREILEKSDLVEKLKSLRTIEFTDHTTLRINLEKVLRCDTIGMTKLFGYSQLIRQAIREKPDQGFVRVADLT